MLSPLIAALLALAVQDPQPAPQEAKATATCQALEKALAKDAPPAEALPVLQAAIEIVDPRVIDVIASKGLRHADPALRSAAVEALGRMNHPDALRALHEMLKRDRKDLQEEPPRHAALLRAIARHGSESSISLLGDDVFQSPDRGVVSARILGLGRIRSPRAVEELFKLMRLAPRPRMGDHMQDFRLALVVLTGADKGTDQELWLNWYGDNKSKLEVAPAPPELPRELRRRWNAYWGEREPDDDAPPGAARKRKGG
jgi:hypothetical protein